MNKVWLMLAVIFIAGCTHQQELPFIDEIIEERGVEIVGQMNALRVTIVDFDAEFQYDIDYVIDSNVVPVTTIRFELDHNFLVKDFPELNDAFGTHTITALAPITRDTFSTKVQNLRNFGTKGQIRPQAVQIRMHWCGSDNPASACLVLHEVLYQIDCTGKGVGDQCEIDFIG